jgi:hypothetical protein
MGATFITQQAILLLSENTILQTFLNKYRPFTDPRVPKGLYYGPMSVNTDPLGNPVKRLTACPVEVQKAILLKTNCIFPLYNIAYRTSNINPIVRIGRTAFALFSCKATQETALTVCPTVC